MCPNSVSEQRRSLLRRTFIKWADAVEAAKEEEEKQRREDAMWSKINGWLADHRKVSNRLGRLQIV